MTVTITDTKHLTLPLTVGGCVGGGYFGGWAATGSLCYAFTPSGQSGYPFSAGGGGGGPFDANALIGPIGSNAQTLCDLGGWFGHAEASAGVGPYSPGSQVRPPIPIPFSAGGKAAFTWTFGQIG